MTANTDPSDHAASSTAVEGQVDQEFVAAEQAIEDAASYANAAQAAGDAGENAAPVVRSELTPEQRRELARATAKRQRRLGAEELSRVYPGTIVIQRQITIADPAIASSASRFLGLTDRTIYLVNRFGQRYHTASEIEAIRESLHAVIDAYCKEAEATLAQGRELAQQAKEKLLDESDWLVPSYTSNTLDVNFGVKARDTIALVRALQTWDAAILEFAALEFNDTASIGQIETMRLRERRMFSAISRLCLRTIGGFSKRRDKLARSRAEAAQERTEEATAEA